MGHVPEKGNLLVSEEYTVQIIITVDTDQFRSQEYKHNCSIIKYGCSMSNFLRKERTAFRRKEAIPSAWWLSNTFTAQQRICTFNQERQWRYWGKSLAGCQTATLLSHTSQDEPWSLKQSYSPLLTALVPASAVFHQIRWLPIPGSCWLCPHPVV